jgi:hypothetical protein
MKKSVYGELRLRGGDFGMRRSYDAVRNG